MSWIKTIPPEQAEGELLELYNAIGAARGGIAEVHRVQSLNPRALRAHLELYKSVVFARSTLSRVARERIAVVVSEVNRCAYCVAHHGEALRQLRDDAAVVEGLGKGEIPKHLPVADHALLRWAQRAAREPKDCGEAKVSELRALGYDDRAILDAALTVAYFSFVNRLVLLLGVEVETDYHATCGDERDRGP
ncbi:MAG: peroxidase-related enzyme [Sandaracinaceae bacterium]|nr:peroxidase-related enzyme [Sandaracinaceae bacterium]